MKTKLIILAMVFVGLFVFKAGAQTSAQCRDGTFSIGEGVCRRVTGCAYGDQIPKDSPDCKPRELEPKTTIEGPVTDDIWGGK